MACETAVETFLKISGIVGWIIVLIITFILWQQRNKLKAIYGTSRAVRSMKEMKK